MRCRRRQQLWLAAITTRNHFSSKLNTVHGTLATNATIPENHKNNISKPDAYGSGCSDDQSSLAPCTASTGSQRGRVVRTPYCRHARLSLVAVVIDGGVRRRSSAYASAERTQNEYYDQCKRKQQRHHHGQREPHQQ